MGNYIYVVDVPYASDKPLLYSAPVGKRTAKQVRIAAQHSGKAFEWHTVFPAEDVSFTPEEAIAKWRAKVERSAQIHRDALALCEKYLASEVEPA